MNRSTGIKRATIPVLRKGSQGQYVRWLQILLNLHDAGNTPLKVDGSFGQKTLDAVHSFQISKSLTPDGVVGFNTWTRLQIVQAELPTTEPAPQQTVTSVQPAAISGSGPSTSVADWSLTRRFTEVVQLSPRHMLPELAAQFRAMLTPFNLSLLVATLVAWAVSHAFGPGEVADIIGGISLALGPLFFGLNLLQAAKDLYDCLAITVEAEFYSDLDRASDRLAEAIVIIGIMAFFALIARVAGKLFRRGSPPGDKIPPSQPPVPEPETKPPANEPPAKQNAHEATQEPPKNEPKKTQGGQNNKTGGAQPKSNPLKGEPGSQSSTSHADGSPKQVREYGPDGYPDKDVDFGHDHGQGDPHVHDWSRPSDGSPPTMKNRGIGRPPTPDDPAPNQPDDPPPDE